MALPITKKAAASCAKNIEAALVAGAGKTAPGFIDVKKTVEDSMGEVKPQETEDTGDVEVDAGDGEV